MLQAEELAPAETEEIVVVEMSKEEALGLEESAEEEFDLVEKELADFTEEQEELGEVENPEGEGDLDPFAPLAPEPVVEADGGQIAEDDNIEEGEVAPVPLPEESEAADFLDEGILPATSADAGPGAISGEIFDEESGAGLPGVIISAPFLGNFRVRSDDQGRFTMKGLPLGSNLLKFTKSGYISSEQEIEIKTADAPVAVSQGLVVRPVELDDEEYLMEDYDVVVEYEEETVQGIVFDNEGVGGLVSGIGKEIFSKTGVSDAAGAVTKISGANIVGGKYAVVRGLGDRYTNTTVNGGVIPSADPSRKAVQLDLFPTDLLQSVNIYKTFTPDLPAEFVGGLIAVETLQLPEERSIKFSLGTGWNSLANDQNSFLGIPGRDIGFFAKNEDSYLDNPALASPIPTGSRFNPVLREATENARRTFYQQTPFFAEDKGAPDQDYSLGFEYGDRFELGNGWDLGVVASFTHGQKHRYKEKSIARVGRASLLQEDFERVESGRFVPTFFNESNGLVVGIGTTQTRDQEDFTRSVDWGALLGVTLENGDSTKLSGTFFKYRTGEDTVKLTKNQLRADDSFAATADVILNDLSILRSGEQTDAREYWQTLETTYRDLELHQFTGQHDLRDGGKGVKLNWLFGTSNAEEIRPRDVNVRFFKLSHPTLGEFITPVNPVNTSNAQSSFVLESETKDEATELKGDLTFSFLDETSEERKLDFRLGIGSYQRTRESDARRLSFNLGSGLLSDILRENDLFFEQQQTDDLNNGNVNTDGQTANRSDGWIVSEANGSTLLTFTGDSEIISAYGMVDTAINEWTLRGGSRWEEETRSFSNAEGDTNSQTKARFYPGVVLSRVFGSDEQFSLDLAWSKTVARPTFYEFVDASTLDQANNETFAGNPGLTDTKAENYDLRLSYFGEEVADSLSLGLFYKSLNNPIVQITDPFGDDRITWTNFEEATLYGAELDFSKELGGGFQIFGNVSHIISDIPDDVFNNPFGGSSADISAETLEGQPNWLGNLVLSHYYEPWDFTTSISYNYTGSYLHRLVPSQGATAQNPSPENIIRQPFQSLDLVLSKRWEGEHVNGKIGFKFKNILDNDEEFTYGDVGLLPFEKYSPGREYSFSLDLEF